MYGVAYQQLNHVIDGNEFCLTLDPCHTPLHILKFHHIHTSSILRVCISGGVYNLHGVESDFMHIHVGKETL